MKPCRRINKDDMIKLHQIRTEIQIKVFDYKTTLKSKAVELGLFEKAKDEAAIEGKLKRTDKAISDLLSRLIVNPILGEVKLAEEKISALFDDYKADVSLSQEGKKDNVKDKSKNRESVDVVFKPCKAPENQM